MGDGIKVFSGLKSCLHILKALLIPKEMCDAVTDIDCLQLYSNGYRTMIIDLDNTILPVSEVQFSLHYINWIERANAQGFQIYIVSNNSSYRRVNKACSQIHVQGLYFAMKPLALSVKDLVRKEYIDLEKTVVIGDQMLTDVALGNWLKTYTILVDPMDKKLSFIKTLQREIEVWLLKRLQS